MSTHKTTPDTRRRILQAAATIVLRQGTTSLTLEAAAKEAKVSKGGLLYHFPTKEALIEGLARQLCDDFDASLKRFLESEPPGPGRWLRAYIRATFAEQSPALELSILLAASAPVDALFKIVQDYFSRAKQLSEADGIPPARAHVIRLAADGYWLASLLSVLPDETERIQVMDELLQLTREGN